MSGLTSHTGRLAVYAQDHVDTDRIVPARFLSRVERSGYGELLFKDVRGESFPLDQPESHGASILVVGTNFGCGSSREHAVWAVQQAGFKVVIARKDPDSPGFSDIFRGNAVNCGLLLIELSPEDHALLVKAGNGAKATVDLPAQEVRIGDRVLKFDISPAVKEQIVAGHDLVGSTLLHEREISEFEQRWDSFAPRQRTEQPSGASK